MTPDTLQDRLKGLPEAPEAATEDDVILSRVLKAHCDVLRALMPFAASPEAAANLLVAISEGRIPHVSIVY